MATWGVLNHQIVNCRLCPRLVQWREQVALEKVKRYRNQEYWGRPVTGFGDTEARVLLVGLAPAAHGGNRTGRVFTGDRSGDWLFRALHRTGFANQSDSTDSGDGLRLTDCFVTAAARCAPPANKPTREEMSTCRPYLLDELRLLKRLRVVIGLGKIGYDSAFDAMVQAGLIKEQRRPRFAHGAVQDLGTGLWLMGTYHPSQQNTFTGRLTESMLENIFDRARELAQQGDS